MSSDASKTDYTSVGMRDVHVPERPIAPPGGWRKGDLAKVIGGDAFAIGQVYRVADVENCISGGQLLTLITDHNTELFLHSSKVQYTIPKPHDIYKPSAAAAWKANNPSSDYRVGDLIRVLRGGAAIVGRTYQVIDLDTASNKVVVNHDGGRIYLETSAITYEFPTNREFQNGDVVVFRKPAAPYQKILFTYEGRDERGLAVIKEGPNSQHVPIDDIVLFKPVATTTRQTSTPAPKEVPDSVTIKHQYKVGDRVIVTKPDSKYHGKGEFPVVNIDTVGDLHIQTPDGIRGYKPSSVAYAIPATTTAPSKPDGAVEVRKWTIHNSDAGITLGVLVMKGKKEDEYTLIGSIAAARPGDQWNRSLGHRKVMARLNGIRTKRHENFYIGTYIGKNLIDDVFKRLYNAVKVPTITKRFYSKNGVSVKTMKDTRYFTRSRPIDSLVLNICAIFRPEVKSQTMLSGAQPYSLITPTSTAGDDKSPKELVVEKSASRSLPAATSSQSSPKTW